MFNTKKAPASDIDRELSAIKQIVDALRNTPPHRRETVLKYAAEWSPAKEDTHMYVVKG